MAKMKSLEMTKAEIKKDRPFLDDKDLKDANKFSHGTLIRLDNISLKKLDMKSSDFNVEGEVMIMAKAKVVEVEHTERIGDEARMSVELQITDMNIAESKKELSTAESLFGEND